VYEAFYGLTARPFDITSNPRTLFLTDKYREALSHVQYGIESRSGITVLIGEAGVGKSTMLRAALDTFGAESRIAVLSNPALMRAEFLQFLAQEFGLPADSATSKFALFRELHATLLRLYEHNNAAALVVDEAQSLPVNLLREIRLLANLEVQNHKLLPIVLAGQPELADVLNQQRFQPLKQRVAFRCVLDRLTLAETASYIVQRIRSVGGQCNQLLTRGAVVAIHERSRGIPRTINVICNNALIAGFARNERPVAQKLVLEVCDHLDLARSAESGSEGEFAASAGASPHGTPDMEDTRERSELVDQVLSRRRV